MKTSRHWIFQEQNELGVWERITHLPILDEDLDSFLLGLSVAGIYRAVMTESKIVCYKAIIVEGKREMKKLSQGETDYL